MAIVTDKQYYLDDMLIKNLDFCIKRQKKKFDHLIILDGKEGYGKTTFSLAIAYYLAEQTNTSFSLEQNVFFDLDKLLDVASRTEKQVFICRFGTVATMVEPVGFNVRCELAFDLPRVQVMAGYGS